MTAAARWAREHRRREREGLITLQIVVPEVELLEVLRISGWIGEFDPDPERGELARIMEAVIRTWVLPASPYDAP